MSLARHSSGIFDVVGQLDALRSFGEILCKSGMMPQAVSTPEKALVIILKGQELGLEPMAALAGIVVIQGKATISPQLMLSLIDRSGLCEDRTVETGAQGATVTMKRRGRSPHTSRFGPAEAKAMGLDTKDNYKKQAPVMYQWRAVAACARVVFPDVIDGLYTPEEMGADVQVDEDGAMTVEVAAAPAQEGRETPAKVTQEAKPTPEEAEREKVLQAWASKIGKAGARLTELNARDRATETLARFQWRTDPAQAEAAYQALCAVGVEIQAAQQPVSESDTVDAEFTPAPDAAPIHDGQRKALMGYLNRAGVPDSSEARSAFYHHMAPSSIPAGTRTNALAFAQARGLLELLAPMDPDTLAQTGAEFLKEFRPMSGKLLDAPVPFDPRGGRA